MTPARDPHPIDFEMPPTRRHIAPAAQERLPLNTPPPPRPAPVRPCGCIRPIPTTDADGEAVCHRCGRPIDDPGATDR